MRQAGEGRLLLLHCQWDLKLARCREAGALASMTIIGSVCSYFMDPRCLPVRRVPS
jgi:hypothetical protein